MSNTPTEVVLATGDGIGPEVAKAALNILDAAGANIKTREFLVGEAAFDAGYETGIEPGTVEAVKETGIMLKAPLGTPSGGGFKSLNVTLRRELDLWANVRPAVSYPQLHSPQDGINLTVFRENTEDSYVGLTKDIDAKDSAYLLEAFGEEYSDLGIDKKGDASLGIQIISDKASAQIVQAAFDFARANESAEVHGMSKSNILKATDGRFRNNFTQLSEINSDVESRFSIADAGFGMSAAYPVDNGVIVTQNLYGDILSDVMAFQAHGSLGLAPSVNIGGNRDAPIAMYEAVHGTAPDIQGKGIANPSAFLLSTLMMLRFVGKGDIAATVHNALLKTWEDGNATGDLMVKSKDGTIKRGSMNTEAFSKAVIGNLGKKPESDFTPCYIKDDYRALLPAPTI